MTSSLFIDHPLREVRIGTPFFGVDPYTGKVVILQVQSMKLEDDTNPHSEGIYSFSGNYLKDFYTLSVEEAIEKSKEQLQLLLSDETLSIVKHKSLQSTLDEYSTQTDTLQSVLMQTVKTFRHEEHFCLGQMLWYADISSWEMKKGILSNIKGYSAHKDSQYGYPQYHLGWDPGVTNTKWFFTSEKAALNFMEKSFSARYPGTLDKSRVETRPPISLG